MTIKLLNTPGKPQRLSHVAENLFH